MAVEKRDAVSSQELLEKTLKVTMVGLDYLAFYLLGNLSDNKLNQKRALEADLTNNSIDKK